MNPSSSGKCSSIRRNSPTNSRSACRRLVAVSKISANRTRIAYSSRSCGTAPNSASNSCFCSSVSASGRLRKCHILERNCLRSARVSFALYARVIFFPLGVDRLVEQLGDVEAVHHRPRLGQQRLTGVVEGLPHVRPVRPHPAPLTFAELSQALPPRRLVAALGDRQHLGVLRVAQVGQEGRSEEHTSELQ